MQKQHSTAIDKMNANLDKSNFNSNSSNGGLAKAKNDINNNDLDKQSNSKVIF